MIEQYKVRDQSPLFLRPGPQLRAWLRERARTEHRSMTAEALVILEREFLREQRPETETDEVNNERVA